MTFEDFEKANPEKLREEARSCFDKAEANPSWGGAPTLLLQAQFLMMERDRREAGRIAKRDLNLEIIVIGLIALAGQDNSVTPPQRQLIRHLQPPRAAIDSYRPTQLSGTTPCLMRRFCLF
jgi:hypothetical protein